MAEVTERIANFSPEKVRQLARRFSKKDAAAMTIPRLGRETNTFPLSFGQERLWFLDQLNPGNPAYNLPFAFRFRFPMDPGGKGRTIDSNLLQHLHRSTINELVRRHETLRTSFPTSDGLPIQVVESAAPVPLEFIELLGLSDAEREEAAKRIIRADALKPFDLARGPLCRFGLIQFAPNDHVGFCIFHHIVVDGWSQKTLIKEFQSLLFSALVGRASLLPELPIQYADYAVWQREWLQGELWDRLRQYWTQQLKGLPDLLLPTDHPRPAVQSFAGATEPLFLPNSFCSSLRQMGQNHGVTLSMTLLAAWLTLLMRYTGETDVAVCTPVANRTHIETECLIGFFVNTLVVRVDLSGDPTFAELLKRVWEVCTKAYAHQEMPFEKLVQELQVSRDLGRNPLSRIAFQLVDIPATPGSATGSSGSNVTVTPVEVDTETSLFDVNCDLWQKPDGIHGMFTYSTDLFEASTVRRMAGHFHTLLRSALSAPECHLSALGMISQDEHEQMLAWNLAASSDDGPPICLHQFFEAQVERTPQAIAVQFERQQLSYMELNGRANALAHSLLGLGVGPEIRVALCVERGLEMIVGLLGILKAGGTYVPLDPNYPLERLQFMLQDSRATALVTQDQLRGKLESFPGHRIYLEQESISPSSEVRGNPLTAVQPDNLAYLIYTSGSTGIPKGVAIQHRSAGTLLHWACKVFSPGQLSCMLASTSICFDLSIFEIFAPLAWGHRIIIVENVLRLFSIPPEVAVTLVNTVPSAMTELLRLGPLPASVTTVALAGEPLTNSLVQQIYRQPNVTAVLNLYGPSEDTTYSTWALLKKGSTSVTPIGRPISNTQVYLLDEYMQPVPMGASAQLYLGGAGLARCYLDRPELTARSFIPDPYGRIAGARLYRTGDIARFRPDGMIEYQGRRDHQVKVRGFRIELGEIETALAQHPEVQEAAVLVCQYDDDNRLVAYVVSSPGSNSTSQDLRQYLRNRLPEHMVPGVIVFLERMPLSANGKLDRLALPDPEQGTTDAQSVFVAPRDVIELQLVRVWEEILNIRPVGVRDNFFDLGGHSLVAVRLMARIRVSFQQELPLKTLFQAPDVEQLARRLRQGELKGRRSPLVLIQTGAKGHPIFMVHPVGGQVLCYYELARHLGTEQSVYGVEAAFLNQREGDSSSIEEMADEYIDAIQTVEPSGPYLLGGWSIGGIVAFEMAQRLKTRGHDVRLLAILDSPAPHGNIASHITTSRSLVSIARVLEIYTGTRLSVCEENMSKLSREEQLTLVVNEMTDKGLAPPDVDVSYLRGFLHVAENNLRAKDNYVPALYSGRIVVFRAQELLPGIEKEHDAEVYRDPALGWQQLSTEPVVTHSIPGNHVSMLNSPNVQALAGPLRQCLDEVQSG